MDCNMVHDLYIKEKLESLPMDNVGKVEQDIQFQREDDRLNQEMDKEKVQNEPV